MLITDNSIVILRTVYRCYIDQQSYIWLSYYHIITLTCSLLLTERTVALIQGESISKCRGFPRNQFTLLMRGAQASTGRPTPARSTLNLRSIHARLGTRLAGIGRGSDGARVAASQLCRLPPDFYTRNTTKNRPIASRISSECWPTLERCLGDLFTSSATSKIAIGKSPIWEQVSVTGDHRPTSKNRLRARNDRANIGRCSAEKGRK